MKELKYTYGSKGTLLAFYDEVITRKIYEKFFEVQEDDIVMDIGAMIGTFEISISNKKYKKCYVIEPDPINFSDLKINCADNYDRLILINEGIDFENKLAYLTNDNGTGSIYGNGTIPVLTRKIKDIFENYKIEKINFLKIDCEGGEYSLFHNDNKEILKDKIDFISGEIHNEPKPEKETPHFNRKNILNLLECLENYFDVFYTSVDGIKIENIRNGLGYYRQFLFYASNKNLKNNIQINFIDGKVRVEGIKLEKSVNVKFQDMNDEVLYSSQISENTWSMTTVDRDKWKIFIETPKRYEATVSESESMKYIKF